MECYLRERIQMTFVQERRFPSKVLMFGEYTVLFGGQALAIPYPQYSGGWIHIQKPSTYDLSGFFYYLENIKNRLHAPLKSTILADLKNHWSYDSNIPAGMGLGSSAALSASIYQICGQPDDLSLEAKKSDLAVLESFFHGKSSGFDPLVSLENDCMILSSDGRIKQIELIQPSCDVYLLFSQVKRDAQTLISRFQANCKLKSFKKQMEHLATLSSQAIKDFIGGDFSQETLQEISELQFNHLDFLIIPVIKDLWYRCLNNSNFNLKLCGAGGGGCYLLFSSQKVLPNYFQRYHLEKIKL